MMRVSAGANMSNQELSKAACINFSRVDGSNTNVGKTIITNPPVITISIGGMVIIPSHGW